jgi:hypothetical protein
MNDRLLKDLGLTPENMMKFRKNLGEKEIASLFEDPSILKKWLKNVRDSNMLSASIRQMFAEYAERCGEESSFSSYVSINLAVLDMIKFIVSSLAFICDSEQEFAEKSALLKESIIKIFDVDWKKTQEEF